MKMNLPLALLFLVFIIHKVMTGAIKAPLNIITLDDISEDERKHLDAVHVQYERSKRSGSSSPDLLGSLKTLLAQGAKAKLRLIGRASASASSSLVGSSSSSSSSGGKSYPSPAYSYHPYPSDGNDSDEANLSETFTNTDIDRIDRRGYKEKPDPWSMKKAVLNTLLQAVKAIKGGVLALKGQLIKGGGYLLVGGGKLVKAKGEAITNIGKKIARTAFREMHSSEVHEDGSFGHYHPAEIEYEHASGPGPSFPDHFHHSDYHGSFPEDKAHGVQSGILILKKMPSGKNTNQYHGAESTITEQKASGPSFETIVGKLLSAASSSNPDSPAPFTDYRHTHPQPDDYPGDGPRPSDDTDQHDQGNFDTNDFELEPAFDSSEANKAVEPGSSGSVSLGPHSGEVSEVVHGDVPEPSVPLKIDQELPKNPPSDFNGVPQGSHLNSFVNQQLPYSSTNQGFANLNQNYLNNAHNNFNLVGGEFAEPPPNYLQDQNIANNFQYSQGGNKPNSPNIFDHNLAEPPSSFLQYNLDPNLQGLQLTANFESFKNAPSQLNKNDFTSNTKFLGPLNPDFLKLQGSKPRRPPPPKKSYDKYRGNLRTPPKINHSLVDPSSNLDLPQFQSNRNNFPPLQNISEKNRPSFIYNSNPSKTRQPNRPQFNNYSSFTRSKKQPRPPNFDIVQSVTYQLGPNGPKKL